LFSALLIIMLATPRKSRSEDFENLSKINNFKRVVLLLRIVLITMFLFFLYFIDKISLDIVRVFTLVCFFILFMDILLNLIILFLRLKGLCRTGSKYPYVRMNEDYVELQENNNTTLNNWLMQEATPQRDNVGTQYSRTKLKRSMSAR
jgi:uncharacterized membrane protein